MDLYIEALTGTFLELRVSPFEAILSIKSKVQRLSGIPVSQQHLIWQGTELEDDFCLHDYNIISGATLKLVLGIRGGPISIRGVPVEDHALQEIEEYMEAKEDEIRGLLMQDDQQVTLLVCRDGDQLNFFRVHERADGTLTPYTESMSGYSVYNMYEDEDTTSNGSGKGRREEDLITKFKMQSLKEKLASKSIKKKETIIEPRPPSSGRPSSNLAGRRLRYAKNCPSRQSVIPKTESSLQQYDKSPSPQSQVNTVSAGRKSSKFSNENQARKALPPVCLRGKDSNNIDVTDILTACPSKREVDTNCDVKVIKECNEREAQTPNLRDLRSKSTLISARKSQSKYSPKKKNEASPCTTETDKTDVASLMSKYPKNQRLPRISNRNETVPMKHDISKQQSNNTRNGSHTKLNVLKPLGSIDDNVSQKLAYEIERSDDDKEPGFNIVDKRKGKVPQSVTSESSSNNYPEAQLEDILRDSVEYENYRKFLNWVQPRLNSMESRQKPRESFSGNADSAVSQLRRLSSREKARRTPDGRDSARLRSSKVRLHGNSSNHLPPVTSKNCPPTFGKSQKRMRCFLCSKKLGLASNYTCRCGKNFCGKHRYPETHTCTYDFKTEGRKLLEKNNPLVVAPKLPKI